MRRISPDDRIVQFSLLPAADLERLNTWLTDIALSLLPGTPVHAYDGEIRLGRKGSLAIYPDAHWMDFEADQGGSGALSLITHLMEVEPAGLRHYARDWLHTHPGPGPLLPDRMHTNAADARDQLHAAYAREVLERRIPLAGTAGERNLIDRGLTGPWPDGLVGHLSNARLGESALIGVLTNEVGAPIGVQLGYLVPDGRKSVLPPQRNLFYLEMDRERRRSGLFRIPATAAPNGEDDSLDGAVLLVEGLEGALAVHMAFPRAQVLGMPGIGRLRHLPPIEGTAIIVRDGDGSDSSAVRSLIKGIDHLLLGGATVRVTLTPAGEDADSIVRAGGVGALRDLILQAPAATLSPRGEIQRLAGMSVIDYEQERTEVAKRLGLRKSALDTMVASRRPALNGDDEKVDRLALGPEPWETPIADVGAVLAEASDELAKYIVASQVVRDTAALWALHTHLIHHPFIQLEVSPRLAIKAAAPSCGKSTLLDLVQHMTCRPMVSASLTPATVFRVMDALHPTLLLDEIDHALRANSNPELLAILRASHRRRTAFVVRLVPTRDGDWKPQMFSAWCTYGYTATGKIEEALQSRAVTVMLLRAKPGELARLRRLTEGTSQVLLDCGRKFARWAMDQVTLPDAKVPAGISHRDQDNWAPLCRLAVAAGDDWQQRTQRAAETINGVTVAIGDVVPLLRDIREAFGERDRMATETLVAVLLAMLEPSRDWTVAYHGRPINAYYLRDALKDVIDPPEDERRWRDGNLKVRGYLRRHFDDAFARYLPEAGNQGAAPAQEKTTFSPIVPPKTSGPSGPVTKTQPNSTTYDQKSGPDEAKTVSGPGRIDPAHLPAELGETRASSGGSGETAADAEEWSQEPAPE